MLNVLLEHSFDKLNLITQKTIWLKSTNKHKLQMSVLWGWVSLNPLKMKICDQNPFFQVILNKLLRMTSADIKANVKQQIKDLVVLS